MTFATKDKNIFLANDFTYLKVEQRRKGINRNSHDLRFKRKAGKKGSTIAGICLN